VTAWTVEITPAAERQLDQLDRPVRARIVKALARLAATPDPTAHCKALSGRLAGLWRYRVGDWRVVCDIQRRRLLIEVVTVGPRGSVYD
jgi:mRNA interferase RelE/StbE